MNAPQHPPFSRRQLLKAGSCGFGYLAFAGLASQAAADARNPLAARMPHFTPRARRVIFLFMNGGPSQMDTFDYKPELSRRDGTDGTEDKSRIATTGKLFGSPWKFRRYGESGLHVSDLMPHVAKHIDDLCVVRSMQTDSSAHPLAVPLLHTGSFQFRRPSMGSWVIYGLGSDAENLPGFITINPTRIFGGPSNYGSAFLPAAYQATRIGWEHQSLADATVRNVGNDRIDGRLRSRQLDLIQSMNRRTSARQPDAEQAEGVIDSFELGPRMAEAMPQVMDLNQESEATREMYGIGDSPTDTFGRQALMARRFAEAGVRFIQLTDGSWDQHANLPDGHGHRAKATDKPVAALLADLKQRGMLEDTLVVWGGEFGRTPESENKVGRNHLADGFTFWLAGGGVQGGLAYGETDELGYEAVDKPVHLYDLHATILHLLGLDHTRLTYRHAGRDFRLTDVHGNPVTDILA